MGSQLFHIEIVSGSFSPSDTSPFSVFLCWKKGRLSCLTAIFTRDWMIFAITSNLQTSLFLLPINYAVESVIRENEFLDFLQSSYWEAGGVDVAGETTDYSWNALRRLCCLWRCAVRSSIDIYFFASIAGAKP